jgi:hypothetical protein
LIVHAAALPRCFDNGRVLYARPFGCPGGEIAAEPMLHLSWPMAMSLVLQNSSTRNMNIWGFSWELWNSINTNSQKVVQRFDPHLTNAVGSLKRGSNCGGTMKHQFQPKAKHQLPPVC